MRLNDITSVKKELIMLTSSLIRRMRLDLMSDLEENDEIGDNSDEQQQGYRNAISRQWIAHPRTLRLTTRPRPPMNPDGSRSRSFTRISKSCNMPSLIFSDSHSPEATVEKLVNDALIPLFRKLHPEPSGWDLSLINLCATNMALSATDDKNSAGRDIGRMSRRQETVPKAWKVDDIDTAPTNHDAEKSPTRYVDKMPMPDAVTSTFQDDVQHGSEDTYISTQESHGDESSWDGENEAANGGEACNVCGAVMPSFAMIAHLRFHSLPD